MYKNGYYGYIDSSGQMVIDLYYTTADMFQNNYAIVSTESGYGVIDESGACIVSPQYARLSWLNEELLQYKPHEAGKEGTYICDLPEIDLGSADNYYLETNGYFALAGGYTGSYGMDIESQYAVIDIVTQEITEYQTVEFISGTEYTVVQDAATGLYGLYDKNQLVEECVYDSIVADSNNKMLLKRGGTETVYGGNS